MKAAISINNNNNNNNKKKDNVSSCFSIRLDRAHTLVLRACSLRVRSVA